MKKIIPSFLLVFLLPFKIFGQELPKNWHLLDITNEGYLGISLQKTYDFLEEKKLKPTKVVVTVLDSGVDIYATILDNKYDTRSGTSMADPVVTGVATLLKSYFPHLTPEQIIEIITTSGTSYDMEVNLPGNESKKVNFSSLSKSGKIVNAYKAVKLAFEKFNN